MPFTMTIKFNILRFRGRIAALGSDCLTKKIYLWSKSLAGPNFNNWARKSDTFLETIQDSGGMLNTDETWYELMKLEFKKWKECVEAIPKESETGGRLRFYCDIKPFPDQEKYIIANTTLNKKKVHYSVNVDVSPWKSSLDDIDPQKPH